MNLVFRNSVQKRIDGKIIYDLTIQDMDGEVAEGRELPFSYVFGKEPTSVIEKYITDHLDELKKVTVKDTFNSDLFKTPAEALKEQQEDCEEDEFTKFYNTAQQKWTDINNIIESECYAGIDYKDDSFVCSHQNFNFISDVISYYNTQIQNKLCNKKDVKAKIISTTNTVHIFNYDQLLELQKLIFERMNQIYLAGNYYKSIKLNECDTVQDIKALKVNFDAEFENAQEVDHSNE